MTEMNPKMIGLFFCILGRNFFSWALIVEVLDFERLIKFDDLLSFCMSMMLTFKPIEILLIFHLKVLSLLLLIHEQKLTQLWVLIFESLLLEYIQCLDVLSYWQLLKLIL